ncbi:MAG: cellulase family glycosylhydrolase [Lentisphaeria bacterium]
MSLELPADFPDGMYVYFFTKDWNNLWRQIRHRIPAPSSGSTVHFELPLFGGQAEDAWMPKPHKRPWHTLTPSQVRRFGFRFVNEKDKSVKWSGRVRLKELRLTGRIESKSKLEVKDVRLNTERPQVGKMCEIRLSLNAYYENPFNGSDLKVIGSVERPDGEMERVKGFYYEGFVTEPGGVKDRLIPYGKPHFRIRYTPRVKGRHTLQISVKGAGERLDIPAIEFEVLAAADGYDGFVRRSNGRNRYLEFDSGKAFRGIGLNIRTPTDTRYIKLAPFSQWQDEGIGVYRRMFPKLAAAGVNTVEVWMSSWWLALEWINDAPGFHGVGYYNQYRAWVLDELLRLAEDNGIYLIMVLNNHGKFSTFCDREWARNPYNKKNGGWLSKADHYFTGERARQAFKNTADYIVARWGYSPNVLCWKLFSEINLTGSSKQSHRKPFMKKWHDEMAKYIKRIDPYNHLITTHWSGNYKQIDDNIARLKSLGILTADAYTGNTSHMVELFDETVQYGVRLKKPVIITEFGGPSSGAPIGVLHKQLHLGLWKGFFSGHAVTPMLWWFGLVDEQNWYYEYRALDAFTRGVDRRGMKISQRTLPENGINLNVINDDEMVLLWGFDQRYYYSRRENTKAGIIKDLSITVSGLEPGRYRLEIWDCDAITPSETRLLTAYRRNDKFDVAIPPFRRDFAVRIMPIE